MSEYMYLFRGGEVPEAQRSPESMQAHMQKWLDWIRSLSQQGTFVILDATLGELHLRAGRPERACAHFLDAMKGALSHAEKRLLKRKLNDCETFAFTATKEGHHADGRCNSDGVRAGSRIHAAPSRAGTK